ncbi:MAG: hypothetical protein LKG38_02660 [Atopobiaceae bacterium]|nr:hypothetical protein [Atopobiaceae bacterium]MCH4119627.1 hypothetical protein [Atopobiaceae bacterium]MCI1318227.1 hypothetical protein [Atopobiaceae bacterium]MCI1388698.1 hypothetical protein [Atopobiaceae bacterium]MCI1432682.1 hypothetical protein [Atopobiaceae bacterium]
MAFRVVTFFATVAAIVVLWPALCWLADIVAGHDDRAAEITLLLGGAQAFIGLLIGQSVSDSGDNGATDYLITSICALIGLALGFVDMLVFTFVATVMASDLGVTLFGVGAAAVVVAIFVLVFAFIIF